MDWVTSFNIIFCKDPSQIWVTFWGTTGGWDFDTEIFGRDTVFIFRSGGHAGKTESEALRVDIMDNTLLMDGHFKFTQNDFIPLVSTDSYKKSRAFQPDFSN